MVGINIDGPCRNQRLCRTTLSAMHVFAVLKWTATILLVYIIECHGRSVEQANTSCVYSFHVPGSQVRGGCPENGHTSEMLRLAESLEKLKCAFEVLQVIMRAYSLHSYYLSKCKLSVNSDQYMVLEWFLYHIINHVYDSLPSSTCIRFCQFGKNESHTIQILSLKLIKTRHNLM